MRQGGDAARDAEQADRACLWTSAEDMQRTVAVESHEGERAEKAARKDPLDHADSMGNAMTLRTTWNKSLSNALRNTPGARR